VGHYEQSKVQLFGKDRFSAGQSQSITIVEGEYDALSVYQMLGSTYPVVSVRSSGTAMEDCAKNYKFLNSFDNIYLCFDNDSHGEEATTKVATLFDASKVRHVQMSMKDANDYLTAQRGKEFLYTWHNAKRYLPKGIVSSYEEIEKLLHERDASSIVSYPFSILQEMTYGIRTGETVLFTALEGVGKTEILRAIEYHSLQETKESIGIIHLEEDERRSVQGLAGYKLQGPTHLPDSKLSVEEVLEGYRSLTKRDNRVYFYSHYGSEDPTTILDTIRFLVTGCGCKIIYLDHLTMLVTGFEGDDERRKLDYISTRLVMMAKELDFALLIVSHVNDDGKPRGSRNIAKVCHVHIHLDRDVEAETHTVRNKTRVTIRKNRFGSHTGPAGTLVFDPNTFLIEEYTLEIAKKENEHLLPPMPEYE